MKKILALLLTVVLSLVLLAGCSDPVYDDLENFLNVEMTEINANYDKLKAEANGWANLEEDADFIASLENVLLPLVNDSLEKLGKISPETDEIKGLRDKYVQMMQAYKDGFERVLVGFQIQDENEIYAGNDKLDEAIALLDEYNAALEATAADLGAKIEY